MNSKEILDTFGKLLIENCYDHSVYEIDFYTDLNREINKSNEREINFYRSLNEEQISFIRSTYLEKAQVMLYYFLFLFEKDDRFKIVFQNENDNEVIDLTVISDNLKGEPNFDDGWINRFSKYSKK